MCRNPRLKSPGWALFSKPLMNSYHEQWSSDEADDSDAAKELLAITKKFTGIAVQTAEKHSNKKTRSSGFFMG
ncbi:MAG: hypothetical protein Q8J78_10495 [Moraxellaceae bacterium]|nr:hypothetical protein [Moraxellaceae bacterium]